MGSNDSLPPYRLDDLRISCVILYFLSQTVDMDRHCSRIRNVIKSPDLFKQLLF